MLNFGLQVFHEKHNSHVRAQIEVVTTCTWWPYMAIRCHSIVKGADVNVNMHIHDATEQKNKMLALLSSRDSHRFKRCEVRMVNTRCGPSWHASACVVPWTYSRTFAAAGPRLWNSLPVQLCNPDITYRLFWRQLQWHVFWEPWTQCSVTFDM